MAPAIEVALCNANAQSSKARAKRRIGHQCLSRRIDDASRLISEVAAWEHQRNADGARINWTFTTDKARAKMGRAYREAVKESESL